MIKNYNRTGLQPTAAFVVDRTRHGGHVVRKYGTYVNTCGNTPLYLCDTADEAESVRLLLEREREEIEAVKLKYEQMLDDMVRHG